MSGFEDKQHVRVLVRADAELLLLFVPGAVPSAALAIRALRYSTDPRASVSLPIRRPPIGQNSLFNPFQQRVDPKIFGRIHARVLDSVSVIAPACSALRSALL